MIYSGRSKKAIISVTLLSAVALWLNYWLNRADDTQKTSAPQSVLQGLTWKSETTSFWLVKAPDDQTRLVAQNIQYDRNSHITTIQQLKLDHLLETEQAESTNKSVIYANLASLRNQDFLKLQGNVVIKQIAPQESRLETEELNYDMQAERLEGNKPVEFQQAELTTHAGGVVAYPMQGLVELKSGVTTLYQPAD